MGKLSKDRRDIYYRKAKEEGFRARSAYKLIQIDESLNILTDKVRGIVDLCAAPGGWCQVLSSRYKSSGANESTRVPIIGVDLQSMSPIDGVRTLKGDITSEETMDAIRSILASDFPGSAVDLVICDGAPDVTGYHDLDERIQHQLVLCALNVAVVLLEPNGAFVSKFFQGRNTDLLLAKLLPLFERVTISKPRSSRSSSHECFIVGQGFKPESLEARVRGKLTQEFLLLPNRSTVSQKLIDLAHAIPFVKAGLSFEWDSDRNYVDGEIDESRILDPVQPPIDPPYKEALDKKQRACHGSAALGRRNSAVDEPRTSLELERSSESSSGSDSESSGSR